jgi:hypothetical protein
VEVTAPAALGDPERPVRVAQLRATARSLMAWGGLNGASSERLIAAALGQGGWAQVADFTSALPGASA